MIYRGISTLYSFEGMARKGGRGIVAEDLSPIPKAAMVVEKGQILWVGPERMIPRNYLKTHKDTDLQGARVFPALTECHTHLIYEGQRAEEFEWRNTGVSYQEIAARGGGILSTMVKTRKATSAKLLASAQTRIDDFLQQGVATVEVKSGYALSLKDELKCLRVAGQLQRARVIPTFLGAHALPPEFKTGTEYLKFLAQTVLPKIKKAKLSRRADIFVEKGFFEKTESREYLKIARDLGFEIVVHADQLTLSGGTELGLEFAAMSVDHVLQIDEFLIQRLAKSQTTAVLLPAADLYMKCAYPPARKLIAAGARVALATDCNPGTSPTQDTQLVGLLARLEMKMTLAEVFAAYTINAAAALKLSHTTGSLSESKSADFYVTDADPEEHFYSVGRRFVRKLFVEGRLVSKST